MNIYYLRLTIVLQSNNSLYILDDCGIVDIDSAFAGAMSFQPAVPSKDMKMLVRFVAIIFAKIRYHRIQ